MELRIDEALWARAEKARRAEWRTLLAELAMRGPVFAADGVSAAEFGFDGERFSVTIWRDGASEVHAVERTPLAPLFAEYLEVIQRLDDDSLPMPRFEALDMAKKVVHDEGARALGGLLPALSTEHEVRRRAFSLFVALLVDTTPRRMAHKHPI